MKPSSRRLLLPLGIAALALLLWDSFVVYPFRIFVVFLHEISHGLAAVLTGGAIESIGLSFDEGGVCRTRGGWPFLILNAGYLGSLLWGATFLVLGERRTRSRTAVAVIGAFTLLVTLLYVRALFGFEPETASPPAVRHRCRRVGCSGVCFPSDHRAHPASRGGHAQRGYPAHCHGSLQPFSRDGLRGQDGPRVGSVPPRRAPADPAPPCGCRKRGKNSRACFVS